MVHILALLSGCADSWASSRGRERVSTPSVDNSCTTVGKSWSLDLDEDFSGDGTVDLTAETGTYTLGSGTVIVEDGGDWTALTTLTLSAAEGLRMTADAGATANDYAYVGIDFAASTSWTGPAFSIFDRLRIVVDTDDISDAGPSGNPQATLYVYWEWGGSDYSPSMQIRHSPNTGGAGTIFAAMGDPEANATLTDTSIATPSATDLRYNLEVLPGLLGQMKAEDLSSASAPDPTAALPGTAPMINNGSIYSPMVWASEDGLTLDEYLDVDGAATFYAGIKFIVTGDGTNTATMDVDRVRVWRYRCP